MKRDYQIVDKANSKKLAEFLRKDGQLRLPLVELITETEMALDEPIDVAGRSASRVTYPNGLRWPLGFWDAPDPYRQSPGAVSSIAF